MEAGVLEAMDTYWQSTYDFLREHFGADAPLIVPDILLDAWPNGATPHQTGGRAPEDFRAIVIHKGDFETFSPRFLRRAIQTLHPAFANEVFVVLVPAEALTKTMFAPPSHVQPLRQMEQWARFQSEGGPAEGVAGRPLTHGELLERMSRFIRRRLVKPVTGSKYVALSETEHTFNNTDWFWVDDTAKAAELFCLPQLRAEDPILTDKLIDFIVDMSEGPFIHRRVGPPALRVEKSNPADFQINNSFTILHGDLTRGRIYVAIRYNDGRTRPLTCLTSNVVSARWRGKIHSCVVEQHIVGHQIDTSDDRVVLAYTSELRADDRERTLLASVTYRYMLRSDRADVGVEVSFDPAPRRLLTNAKLTTTFGELGHHATVDSARFLRNGGSRDEAPPDSGHMQVTTKPFQLMTLDESWASPGFATGLHVVPLNPERLIEVAANANGDKHFGEVSNLYRQRWATSNRPMKIAEARMVTGGGYYEYANYYHDFMTGTRLLGVPLDPSMSYDIGAELNSVAMYIFFAKMDAYASATPSAERIANLKAWFDRHLDVFISHAALDDLDRRFFIFVRSLTFVVMALDTMARIWPEEYGPLVAKCANTLLHIQRPVEGRNDNAEIITSGLQGPTAHPELDSHSTALLALVRSLRHGIDPVSVSKAVARGLSAIGISALPDGAPGQGRLTHETLVIRSEEGGLVDSGYWTFKLGVSLRAFHAIRTALADGRLSLDDDTLAYLTRLEHTARSAIAQAMVVQHDEIEVLTSANSGETNSETQPWVALGLAPATEWGAGDAVFDYEADTGLRLYDDGMIAAAF